VLHDCRARLLDNHAPFVVDVSRARFARVSHVLQDVVL
jgi:hypothetical protein